MGKTRRGGAQWKSGVDTCVFKPAVRCSAREPRREGMVSRVRPGGTAGRDFVIEHRIRTSFPKLVAEGRVIVFDEICSVDYEDEDLKTSPELVACANLGVKKGPQEHANFITPEMDGSLRDYPGSPRTIVGPAVMAAVDMVPDNGPWIIHMDLHPANVLYKVEGDHVQTALADWGRALHIEKPNDIASVRKGIMQWMNSDGDFEGQPLSAFRDALGELDWSVAPHMAALLTDPVVGMDQHLAAIRGWSLDYLLRRLDIEVGDTLLTAPNQAELRKRCQALLAPKGGFSARGRVMVKTRRGGKKWKQGADTCVFDPPVACADGTAIPPNSISRIRSAEDAARDVLIEDTVKELLGPDAKGVVTYSVKCAPKYTPQDLEESAEIAGEEEIRGCGKIAGTTEEDMNLVTAKQVRTLHEHGKKGARKVIRPAVDAAVKLVPDAGPWVIHADCHTGNVLIGEDGFAAMSDWGRAVLIKDPSNIESVREGIRDWIATTDARNLRQVLTEMRAPQHPPEIIANLLPLMETTNDEDGVPIPPSADAVRIAMQRLRGWVPYVLIKHVAPGVLGLDAVLRTNTQAELREAVERVFAPVAKGGKTRRGGMYWPTKYSRGLTRRQNAQRKRSATRRTKMSWKDPKAYVAFKSDKGVKTRRSSYTQRFHKKYPEAKTLPEIAKATGVSKSVLEKVYDRGMAAWRTGHRPGASQQAWGMARVHSFVLKGKTYRTADKDLA